MSFPLNFKNKYFIDPAGGTDPAEVEGVAWAAVAAGINSVDPSFDDETDDTAYYDGEGFGSEDVMGVRASLTFAGHRKYGDVAQDYIAGVAFEVGDARKTLLKWEQPDGTAIVGLVTLSGIKTTGGEANSKQEFEFTATFNGKPKVTPPTPPGP